ncbi:hypothetical protein G5C60_17505 [Streptomyces sp. HC44]|uniref:Uncharacterized protein n=1 Tax=Streptomyces scabichelini TaxID=2711217 RepID=A0A6G4V5P9_9ACTN|nr:hypothetical protein [Streptomyces scabichelini]NGO09346.1 hypothetical protein [Streptomyces scabichelini]
MELRIDSGPEATAEQTDRQTAGLYRDLRTLGVLRVERKSAAAPPGSMAGAGHDLAVLVLSGVFSAAAVKSLSNVLIAYVQRSKARAVEWEFDGHKGSFSALSAKDQHTLVEVVTARISAETTAASGDGSTDGEPGVGDGGTPDRTADRD